MATFSFSTFNLLNFHVSGGDVYGAPMYTDNTYERKAGWLGRRLAALDAEVVGFQEAWSLAALEDACITRGPFDDGQVFGPDVDGQGPSVALASSLPVANVRSIADFPDAMAPLGEGSAGITRFSRPVLRADVTLPNGRACRVYVAHLKSKRPAFLEDEDEDDPAVKAVGYVRSLLRRASEAAALRVLVLGDLQHTDLPVVVLGDLNDAVGAVSNRVIAGDPPWIAHSLEKKKAAWDILLYSTYERASKIAYRDVHYTHIHDGHHETLDHILVSQELLGYTHNPAARFLGLDVWNDHLNGWNDKTRSDHGLVVARFRTVD